MKLGSGRPRPHAAPVLAPDWLPTDSFLYQTRLRTMKRSVLIVDDDSRIRTSLAHALSSSDTTVRTAADADAALASLAESPADIVLADVRMPGMDGLDLLRLLRERAPEVAVVLMTAYDNLPTAATAMREGAADFLVKPLDLHQLRGVISEVWATSAPRWAPATKPAV
jgi:DNA-binding NtrC family response regulator